LSAEPQVETVKVKKREFLILGSVSLWNRLSDDKAVELVDTWLRDQKSTEHQCEAYQNSELQPAFLDIRIRSKDWPPRQEDDLFAGRGLFNPRPTNAATELVRHALDNRALDADSESATVIVVFFE